MATAMASKQMAGMYHRANWSMNRSAGAFASVACAHIAHTPSASIRANPAKVEKRANGTSCLGVPSGGLNTPVFNIARGLSPCDHAAMDEVEHVSGLIGEIYDAALDQSLWPGLLAKTADYVGGVGSGLFRKDVLSKTGHPIPRSTATSNG